MSDIELRRAGTIAFLTLNRPERRNAFHRATWVELAETVERLNRDLELRCLIIAGAGPDFSPGNDISRFAAERGTTEAARAYDADIRRATAALLACPVPVVAAIKGNCVGGGLVIAACCDIRLGDPTARFGVPVGRLGLVLAQPEMMLVMAIAGPALLAEFLYEGRVIAAEEALQRGIVNRLSAEVDAEAEGVATRIAGMAPLSTRWHKAFLRQVLSGRPIGETALAEAYACYSTRDFAEGWQAFLAKRLPDFKGE